jgi:hypothetical protein
MLPAAYLCYNAAESQQQQLLSRWSEAMQHLRPSQQQWRRSSSTCLLTPLQSSRAARSSDEVRCHHDMLSVMVLLLSTCTSHVSLSIPSMNVRSILQHGWPYDAQLYLVGDCS